MALSTIPPPSYSVRLLIVPDSVLRMQKVLIKNAYATLLCDKLRILQLILDLGQRISYIQCKNRVLTIAR